MFRLFFSHFKHHKYKYLTVIFILIMTVFIKKVLIDIIYVNKQFAKNKITTPWGEKIKSGDLSVDYSIDQTFSDIAQLGLNTVNVPVEIDIPSLTSDTMSINMESKERAIQLIKKLRYKGINVILEPYPYIKNGELYETQLKPEDVNIWFLNWKQTVLGPLLKDVAIPCKVYAFCIGSNFDQIENSYGYWTDVAKFVKTNYPGKITYKTNWWYTAEWDTQNIPLYNTYLPKLNDPVFGKVDFISVAAYFELTDKEPNSVDDLVNSLHGTTILQRNQDVYEELKGLSFKWNKPVFFGELGFPKRSQAAEHPWNPSPSDILDNQEQANCFQAYKNVFEKESWNLGFSVFAIGKNDENKHYYPSAQSMKVIKNWYQT